MSGKKFCRKDFGKRSFHKYALKFTFETKISCRIRLNLFSFVSSWTMFLIYFLSVFNSAMKVAVLGLDKTTEGEWVRVTVNVMTRFKRSLVRVRLGNEFLWIPRRDYKCKCPKLRPGRHYLIAGSVRSTRRKKSLVVDHRSMVVSWNASINRKLERIKKKCRKKTQWTVILNPSNNCSLILHENKVKQATLPFGAKGAGNTLRACKRCINRTLACDLCYAHVWCSTNSTNTRTSETYKLALRENACNIKQEKTWNILGNHIK